MFTDPSGDLLDAQGKSTTGEKYVDMVGVELTQTGSTYVARVKVLDLLPASAPDSSFFFEYGLLIDCDQDVNTYPWGSSAVIANKIGVDVAARLILMSGGYSGELLTWPTSTIYSPDNKPSRQKIDFLVEGAVAEIRFDASMIENPMAFDFVFAVRKYVSNKMILVDKCPNEGWFTFSDGKMSLVVLKSGQPTEKLQTDHSIIYYNQGNDQKAKWYGEAFENAYVQIGRDLGAYPAKQFTLYAYLTQADLVLGLQLYSGFSVADANYFSTGGAPRPVNCVMHLSPGFDWHTVTHEYTHTIIEELSGNVYGSIKWLDEGLAEYEGYVTVAKTKYSQTEYKMKADAMRKVYDALDSGKLFSLKELSSSTDWHNRLPGTSARDLQYAESWILVNYLAATYGPSKCKAILLAMKQGKTQELAVQSELGISMMQFETDFRQYLQRIRTEAPNRIAEAEAAVQKAESEGRTVGLSQARVLVQQAKDAMASGDYERAISLADQGKDLASKATAP
jgi:hypothetical protein